jgi:hypothetical protein
MRGLITIGIAVTLVGCGTRESERDMDTHHGHHHGVRAHGHEESGDGAHLSVSTDPGEPVAGQPVTVRMMIHGADGTMVRRFDVSHEERVHLAIIREGLDHFAHLHPAVDAHGNLTVTHAFPAGGTYRLFADYTPAGGAHATATASLAVGGPSPVAPALIPDVPGEIATDGVRATVSAEAVEAGAPVRVAFALRSGTGEPVVLEPFMGEAGHLMFVGVDSWRYVHVHPVGADASRGTVEFEAHFAGPGLYKGWGQFRVDGRVRVVPVVLRVE